VCGGQLHVDRIQRGYSFGYRCRVLHVVRCRHEGKLGAQVDEALRALGLSGREPILPDRRIPGGLSLSLDCLKLSLQ